MKLTDDLARAAARDAGNRSMRAAGRTTWAAEDYQVAVLLLSVLLGESETCQEVSPR